MLVGETYTKRLWTVIELFCFLRMGGTVDRVIVLPVIGVGEANGAELRARARFREFDVKHADCAKPEDRQRLLSCIEAGFGSYTPFNEMVRKILAKSDDAEFEFAPLSSNAPRNSKLFGSEATAQGLQLEVRL